MKRRIRICRAGSPRMMHSWQRTSTIIQQQERSSRRRGCGTTACLSRTDRALLSLLAAAGAERGGTAKRWIWVPTYATTAVKSAFIARRLAQRPRLASIAAAV
jgi:hypothetical protein